MEYAIYPHPYFRITQSPFGNVSHCDVCQGSDSSSIDDSKLIKAIDMGGQHSNGNYREAFYAPFTCKVLKNDSASSGTVYFGSCDRNGNQASIILSDGSSTAVSFAMTHSNDTSWLTSGKIFNAGDHIYNEGENGAPGNEHVHIEFARGWVTTKETVTLRFNSGNKTYKRYPTAQALYPDEVLRKLTGYTNSSKDDSIYTNNSKYTSKFKSIAYLKQRDIYGVFVKAKSTVIVRAYPGSNLTVATIPGGNTAQICSFLGVSSKDNYQWVMVLTSANIYGYVQLDPKNYAIIDPTQYNPSKDLYLYQDRNAIYGGYQIRLNSPVNGAKWVVVPKGRKALIIGATGIQSDGYQWLKVRYTHTDGSTKDGYVQFDTLKHCMVDLSR